MRVPSMLRGRRPAAAATLLAGAVAAAPLTSCNDFLRVDNPSAIEAASLADSRYVNLIVNGVIGEFQPILPIVAYYSGVFGDELRNHHVFFEERLIDLRQVTPENGTHSFFIYTPLQRTRFLADSGESRIKTLLSDSASRDLRLARVQAYGGHTYVLLGEHLCEAPINRSRAYSSEELFAFAIERFDEAIAVATAARAAARTAVDSSRADSVRNFARVGAARAYLNLNNKAKAVEHASLVPAGFEFRAYYSENSTRENNPFQTRLSGGASAVSGSVSNTPFQGLNDPRVPHPTTDEATMSGRAFVPNSPPSFSTYNGMPAGADFSRAGWIRVASYLEAQYIIHEANPTAATLTFVNERRTVGGQAPITDLTGDALLAELRDQRRRDFFLDGHRLGDMRRYKKFYQIDFFPSGAYPGTTTGERFGTNECWPLPLTEINDNPNLRP